MWNIGLALVLGSSALAQQPLPVLRGSWAATVGPKQVLRGVWSAQVVPGRPNSASGSWALLNNANQIMMEGVWSAEKSGQGWHGSWSARVRAGRSSSDRSSLGNPLKGTWQTSRQEAQSANGATLVAMLQRALEKQIAGTWRRGAAQGSWSVTGSR